MPQQGLRSNYLSWSQYLRLPQRSSIKATLKRLARSFYRACIAVIESGLILLFCGRLLLRGLQISLISGHLVISGVPFWIILNFLRDRTARRAYFRQNGKALHDRLWLMGIEEQIKDFYRPQFSDEANLDRYIHQILYDRTGYVGRDYQVNGEGVLSLKAPD